MRDKCHEADGFTPCIAAALLELLLSARWRHAGHPKDPALQGRQPLKEPRDEQTVRRNSSIGIHKASSKTCFVPEQVRLLQDLKTDNLPNSYQDVLRSRSRSYS